MARRWGQVEALGFALDKMKAYLDASGGMSKVSGDPAPPAFLCNGIADAAPMLPCQNISLARVSDLHLRRMLTIVPPHRQVGAKRMSQGSTPTKTGLMKKLGGMGGFLRPRTTPSRPDSRVSDDAAHDTIDAIPATPVSMHDVAPSPVEEPQVSAVRMGLSADRAQWAEATMMRCVSRCSLSTFLRVGAGRRCSRILRGCRARLRSVPHLLHHA